MPFLAEPVYAHTSPLAIFCDCCVFDQCGVGPGPFAFVVC